MNLKTNRLLIRPWTIEDLPHYIAMSQDVGYNCFSPPGIFLTKTDDEAITKIKTRMQLFEEYHVGKFLLFEKYNGSFVGTCGGDFFDLEGNREVELGYRIMLSHWGKGFATEAAIALVSYLLDELKLKSIYGFALQQNQQSLKVLEKAGFNYLREFLWFNLPHKLYIASRIQ